MGTSPPFSIEEVQEGGGLDFIVDCVMAGMARSGNVYPLELSNDLLQQAFQNTIEHLKRNVQVVPEFCKFVCFRPNWRAEAHFESSFF